ncbi:hypothetical protein [Aurantiacibacter spongiae]|uniref:Energy transducer TonB n=1 Tax=Aurantiacibacter spongiae TaxID=2488860 RepID=A0A3N5CSU1_9SPHN|nr:hypothetical protein [Aurantiacibacter spongiae]RPF72233.1 hypothetical protein EG799_11815 [Aurantiacibacter spongiae]
MRAILLASALAALSLPVAAQDRRPDRELRAVPGAAPQEDAAAGLDAQTRLALAEAVLRQLRVHYPPRGERARGIATVVTWGLNPDGTISRTPQVVSQDGVTAANRREAAAQAAAAIRAIEAAAPFALPRQYYAAWSRLTIRFDERM